MTRVAVMQPYLLPYVGYVHLMRAVDIFIWLDDAQFVKQRWMNRNRILLDGRAAWLTLPVRDSPLQTSIRDKRYDLSDAVLTRTAEKLRHAYGRRPGWADVESLVTALSTADSDSVSHVNELLLERALGALRIEPPELLRASDLGVRADSSQDRVIALVRGVGGTDYLNLPGGRDMYAREEFTRAGIDLHFIDPQLVPYPQHDYGADADFVPGLSIIDVIANDAANVTDLARCSITPAS